MLKNILKVIIFNKYCEKINQNKSLHLLKTFKILVQRAFFLPSLTSLSNFLNTSSLQKCALLFNVCEFIILLGSSIPNKNLIKLNLSFNSLFFLKISIINLIINATVVNTSVNNSMFS